VARKVFFQISTVPDHFGPVLAGEPLHLTVQPFSWWKKKFEEDLHCHIYWESETSNAALFYVSAYATPKDITDRSELNVEHEKLRENIKANLSLGLKEVTPHGENQQHVYLLAGGPSLADYEEQITAAAHAGTPIVTMNGTYNWCIARGIEPAAQVLVDARTFNRRFIEPVLPNCKYLIGSQADHETVKSLPAEQVLLWHSDTPMNQELMEGRTWWPVYGGTTVTLRALPLLAMLGFRKVEVFGWDSCLRDKTHHAYEQKENDQAFTVGVTVGGREFTCHPWMVIQAHEFQTILRALARIDGFQLAIHGDGLLAHILATAAQAAKG
jgi:hypothetical protein